MSMTYEVFKERVMKKLQDRLGSGYEFIIAKMPKNNGIVLDGLSVHKKGAGVAPMVYLEHYYERFQEGETFDSLTEELSDICGQGLPLMQAKLSALNDFSRLRDRIVYSLIRTSTNKGFLEDVPSVPYLDLSIVFYLYLEESRFGQMKALIHNCNMVKWGTTADELYFLARYNTPRLLPEELKTMRQVLKEMAKEHLGEGYKEEVMDALLPEHEKVPMYVLSNATGVSGAAALMYPNALKSIADEMGKDLVILPSSIHEVILIPYDEGTVPEEMDRMIYTINREQVPLEDRLSDHAYLYSRDTDMVGYLPDTKAA